MPPLVLPAVLRDRDELGDACLQLFLPRPRQPLAEDREDVAVRPPRDEDDEADSSAPGPSQSKVLPKPGQPKERATEFVGLKTSAPRRLNDIVMAPPELKKLPRGAKSVKTAKAEGAPGAKTLREGVALAAQSIDSGKALAVLDALVPLSHGKV